MKNKKVWISLFVSIAVVFCAALIFAGNYLVQFALVRNDTAADVSPDSIETAENSAIIKANKAAIQQKTDRWLASADREKKQLVSADGLQLTAEIFRSHTGSHRWLIGVHGYRTNKEWFHHIASFYAETGCNVLLPDLRAHGESGGTYIGMGWLDRLDVLQWINEVIALDPAAEIILHGVSMGGATVSMVSGEKLPANVVCIIEDCGYSSVKKIFSDELQYLFGLPPFPFLTVGSIVADIRAGYNFTESSSIKQVAKSTVPMLFIHGSADSFVNPSMVYDLYAACPAEKDLLVVEGAGHANAYALQPDIYFNKVFAFIDTATNGGGN